MQVLGLQSTLRVHTYQYPICVWAAPKWVWSLLDTSWMGKWAVRGKTSKQYFCTAHN